MLKEEDSLNMDKKSNSRPSSVPPKNGTDKKDNGNKPSRYNKKSEYPPRPRNQDNSYRKPAKETNARAAVPSKPRTFDKRPRSRGSYNDGRRDEVTPTPWAEVGTALQSGSKKANLNHLLGFTFEPRKTDVYRGASWKRQNKWGTRRVQYNKEQFLQANCQFVVRNDADYMCHFVDPDILVDWDLIEQVHIFSHELPSCPICLYPPTVARITRCGHIYCWPCILHYLSLGEKTWRKCPICYESVVQKDLKSVLCLETHQYMAGQEIKMRLMKRERGSTFAMPVSEWSNRDCKPHNYEDAIESRFLKLLTINYSQISDMIRKERDVLNQQFNEEGDTLDGSYIQAALDQLKEKELAIEMRRNAHNEVVSMMENMHLEKENLDVEITEASAVLGKKDIKRYASAFSDEEIEDDDSMPIKNLPEDDVEKCSVPTKAECSDTPTDSTDDCRKEASPVSVSDIENDVPIDIVAEELALPSDCSFVDDSKMALVEKKDDSYYFYQAADGQHIYMNSLNARCLAREYGKLASCPPNITATIVELEHTSMVEELRRRLKYLSHLPLTCEFAVAELALKPPLLTKKTLQYFGDEIEQRRRNRQKKRREENRQLRKVKLEEDKKHGKFPELRASLGSHVHFPQYNKDRFSPPLSATTSIASTPSTLSPIGSPCSLNPDAPVFIPGSAPVTASMTGSPDSIVLPGPAARPTTPPWGLENNKQSPTNVSFAQMLRDGKSKPEVWQKSRKVETVASPARKPRRGSESDDSCNEDRIPIPVYSESFGDALQMALDNMSTNKSEEKVEVGGKKKKKAKKLLFTTTMARNK